MEYKIMIKLYVPVIEQVFDLYIPANKSIGQVIVLINKAINSETSEIYPIKKSMRLINKRTGKAYQFTDVVRQTDIKNGSELVIL